MHQRIHVPYTLGPSYRRITSLGGNLSAKKTAVRTELLSCLLSSRLETVRALIPQSSIAGLLPRLLCCHTATALVMFNITIAVIDFGFLRIRHPSLLLASVWTRLRTTPECGGGDCGPRGAALWASLPSTSAAPRGKPASRPGVSVPEPGPGPRHIETQMTAVIG